jgi:ABC-type transporter MlaC component
MNRAPARIRRREAIGLLAVGTMSALVGLTWISRTVWSEASTVASQAVVQDLAAQIWQVFDRTDLTDAERVDALATLLQSKTDVDLLARLVLGRYWNQISAEQRARYQALFRDVVMHNFASRLNVFAKGSRGRLEDHFTIISSAPAGRQDVLVRSRVRPETGEPLAVDWRLREDEGEPVVIDLIIGGVSLLVSQRSEFAAVIERSDMEGLLAELEARASSTSS